MEGFAFGEWVGGDAGALFVFVGPMEDRGEGGEFAIDLALAGAVGAGDFGEAPAVVFFAGGGVDGLDGNFGPPGGEHLEVGEGFFLAVGFAGAFVGGADFGAAGADVELAELIDGKCVGGFVGILGEAFAGHGLM